MLFPNDSFLASHFKIFSGRPKDITTKDIKYSKYVWRTAMSESQKKMYSERGKKRIDDRLSMRSRRVISKQNWVENASCPTFGTDDHYKLAPRW